MLKFSTRISVVIPLYNKEEQIARAIESVLKQSFQNFEVIIVDDGSSDSGSNIVASYTDSRVRLLKQANQGVSAARNYGVSLAECELVAFLDADDAYCHDFLENIWRMHVDYPLAVAYAMNYEMILPTGKKGGSGVSVVNEPELILVPSNFFEIARHGSPVFSSSVAVRKSALQKVGGFPLGVKLGEDLDTWIRLLFFGKIVFSSRVGGLYYSDANIRAMQINAPPAHYIFFDTCDKWVANNSVNVKVANDIEEFKNFFKITYAHFQIKKGDRRLGRTALDQCMTKVFTKEKRRLYILSFLPQIAYRTLSKFKLITNYVLSIFMIFSSKIKR